MNKILHLYQEDFVKELFNRKILFRYPEFNYIKKIEIIPRKNLVWESTYHIVLEFRTIFVDKNSQEICLPIFCTAHSNEPRKNVYESLKFLWANGFDSGPLTVPQPLNYSEYFNASFYQGAVGHNLYHYIREKRLDEIENIVKLSAAWLAKLHNVPIDKTNNYSKANSRIRTVIPGREYILQRIREKRSEKFLLSQRILDELIRREEDAIKNFSRLWLTHGDAHPENIIKTGSNAITVIDFTDLCVTDFARDLGSFTQQMEYMCHKKIESHDFAVRMNQIFLDEYSQITGIAIDEDLKKRIETYNLWTAFRTASFFLIGYIDKPEKAEPLLGIIAERLGIN